MLNIQLSYATEKESWAHGVIEAVVQDVKHVSNAIKGGSPELPDQVVLHLAAASLNATEYTAGYSSYQWAYGKDFQLQDEDVRTYKTIEGSEGWTRGLL